MFRRPKWTILYNIGDDKSQWIGTGWEFYDDEKSAQERYNYLSKTDGFCPTKRSYYHSYDMQHVGAGDRWRLEKEVEG